MFAFQEGICTFWDKHMHTVIEHFMCGQGVSVKDDDITLGYHNGVLIRTVRHSHYDDKHTTIKKLLEIVHEDAIFVARHTVTVVGPYTENTFNVALSCPLSLCDFAFGEIIAEPNLCQRCTGYRFCMRCTNEK